MSAFSKPLADAIFNLVLRNTAFSPPGDIYLGIHVSGGSTPEHPGKTIAAAFANEADYPAYERQIITFDAPGGTENAEGPNAAAVTFPEVDLGEDPFEVTGLSIWSAQRGSTSGTSGMLLLAAPIVTVKEFEPGDVPLVAVGSVIAAFGQEL